MPRGKEAKTRGKLWSEDTTRVLIQVLGEENIQEALNKCIITWLTESSHFLLYYPQGAKHCVI